MKTEKGFIEIIASQYIIDAESEANFFHRKKLKHYWIIIHYTEPRNRIRTTYEKNVIYSVGNKMIALFPRRHWRSENVLFLTAQRRLRHFLPPFGTVHTHYLFIAILWFLQRKPRGLFSPSIDYFGGDRWRRRRLLSVSRQQRGARFPAVRPSITNRWIMVFVCSNEMYRSFMGCSYGFSDGCRLEVRGFGRIDWGFDGGCY